MKQDDVREDIKNKVQDISSCEGECISDGLAYKEADAIMDILSTFLLQKMEKMKKKCGGDLQMNDEYEQCHGWNAALSDCIAIVKETK